MRGHTVGTVKLSLEGGNADGGREREGGTKRVTREGGREREGEREGGGNVWVREREREREGKRKRERETDHQYTHHSLRHDKRVRMIWVGFSLSLAYSHIKRNIHTETYNALNIFTHCGEDGSTKHSSLLCSIVPDHQGVDLTSGGTNGIHHLQCTHKRGNVDT